MRADEREALGAWCEGFAREFGAAPEIRPLASAPPGAPPDLYSITFPVRFEPPEILGGIGHFKGAPAVVEHMRRLGFDWTAEGRIVSAPTPSTFDALAPLLLGRAPGFRLRLHREDAVQMGQAAWLTAYLDGLLPVHVASAEYYERMSARRSTRRELRWHFTALAHDLTVHAQNYHAIPRTCLETIAGRIRAELPDRLAAWRAPGARAPLTLTLFYDNDLNRYCYAVWCRCRTVDDFASTFERHFRQLLQALEVRLAETREGKGDVASGCSEDLPPLQPVEFDLASARPTSAG